MKIQLVAVPVNDRELNDIEHTLQPGPITGNTPAMNWQQQGKWWKQTAGVLRVRNGFAMRGLTFVPVPSTHQHLLLTARNPIKQPEEKTY